MDNPIDANWLGSAAEYLQRAAELSAEAETVSNVYAKNALLDQSPKFAQLARFLDKEASERPIRSRHT